MAKTKVIFKSIRGSSEVVALFPEMAGNNNPYQTCACYQHIGQHGYAHIDWAVEMKNATPMQYASLKVELEQIGYDLWICSRFSRKMLQARIAQCYY